jgi:hypothetical protein
MLHFPIMQMFPLKSDATFSYLMLHFPRYLPNIIYRVYALYNYIYLYT